jgi:phosphoglycolate phosphatase
LSEKDSGPPRRFRAVIFDLDDTLVISTVDYGKFKRLVIEKIVQEGEPRADYSPEELVVGIIARYEAALRSRGVSEREIRGKVAELDRIMDSVELERVSETVAVNGAHEVLSMLKSMGVRVGILTRGCEQYARSALERSRLDGLVDEIEGRNSKTRPKPDPESYLKLARALGVGPEETVFVGDHPMDAQCAVNAGAAFVGVMTGDVPEKDLQEAGSMAVFPDVGQMRSWLEKHLCD